MCNVCWVFQSYLQSFQRCWKWITFRLECRERREFATQAGECMPCHSECKVQAGRETCTGPVWLSVFSLGVLLPPDGIPVDVAILYIELIPPLCKVVPPLRLSVPPPLKGADECVACASLQDGPHCVSSCPEGLMGGEEVIFKYPNKQGRCEPCHINCTQGWGMTRAAPLCIHIYVVLISKWTSCLRCFRCFGPGIRDCVGSSRYISG